MKVLVAMSGGIDSSVAVDLLRKDGHEVQGITFRFFEDADTEAATEMAEFLKVNHLVVNAFEDFERNVIDYAWNEYKNGRTPNPCAHCNRHMKFDYLFAYGKRFGVDRIATGHYAKVLHLGHKSYIRRGLDSTKDQSYFLFGIKNEHLTNVIFPLGNMTKTFVKEIGNRLNFPNRKKKESQGVCFVGRGQTLPEVLEAKYGTTPEGAILNTDGRQVGTHQGIHKYTVGQRKGLGAFGDRVFVKSVDSINNVVTITSDEDLFLDRFYFDNLNLSEGNVGDNTEVQIRYGHPSIGVEKVEGDLVVLKTKVRAITPGQAAVFYNNDTVVGGGWIR
jgi:tRNA-uridine 2-sulfurtransferase